MSTRMLAAMLCGLASVASAQTKISGTSHCNKPEVAVRAIRLRGLRSLS
jgi:hypothetical protein